MVTCLHQTFYRSNATQLSESDIKEIRDSRGKIPNASKKMAEKFHIGARRVYEIWEYTERLQQGLDHVSFSADESQNIEASVIKSEVYNKAEIMIEKVFNMGANLISIVSDSAPSYADARRQLQVKHVQITFLPCYAHQMNLFVGEIFKESVEFKATSTDAIKVALYFKSSLNKYFIGKLHSIQKDTYGKYIQIAIGNDTHWNSHYECFRSMYEPHTGSSSYRRPDEPLYLPANISSILLDEDWWLLLSKLVLVLKPYCIILDILQRDKARLHEVLGGFGYFFKKAINMSKLHASIKYQCKVNEVEAIRKQKSTENIAGPIDLEISEESSTDIQELNNNISEWENLLLREEVDDLLSTDSDDDEFEINELLLNQTHPALDNVAKWQITDIFVENLEIPFFIED
ncbi:12925_t:CDS:2 [Entrophospora sp. SA101]|nr:12925_t:CDS:2 [Entrophospora sp. SA101]